MEGSSGAYSTVIIKVQPGDHILNAAGSQKIWAMISYSFDQTSSVDVEGSLKGPRHRRHLFGTIFGSRSRRRYYAFELCSDRRLARSDASSATRTSYE